MYVKQYDVLYMFSMPTTIKRNQPNKNLNVLSGNVGCSYAHVLRKQTRKQEGLHADITRTFWPTSLYIL